MLETASVAGSGIYHFAESSRYDGSARDTIEVLSQPLQKADLIPEGVRIT